MLGSAVKHPTGEGKTRALNQTRIEESTPMNWRIQHVG